MEHHFDSPIFKFTTFFIADVALVELFLRESMFYRCFFVRIASPKTNIDCPPIQLTKPRTSPLDRLRVI
jgi:hypothetical protein